MRAQGYADETAGQRSRTPVGCDGSEGSGVVGSPDGRIGALVRVLVRRWRSVQSRRDADASVLRCGQDPALDDVVKVEGQSSRIGGLANRA